MELETRSGHGLQTAPQGRLCGYAAVFDSPSHDLGGFREIIKPGAFRRSLENPKNIRALYDHDSRQILGRVGSDTLELREDDKGLRFELQLPDTSYGRDLSILVARGDVAGCSFAFRVRAGGEAWEKRDEETFRVLTDLDLAEITITANPAYPETSVSQRARDHARMDEFIFNPLAFCWLETAR